MPVRSIEWRWRRPAKLRRFLESAPKRLAHFRPKTWRPAVRRLVAMLTLVLLSAQARANDSDVDVRSVIDRGLTFLTKDNLAWRETKKCYECHHAPFTIWALNEAKKQGYPVDEKALAEFTSWVTGKDYLGQLLPKRPEQKEPQQKEAVFNEAPLFLALGLEAGDDKATHDELRQ